MTVAAAVAIGAAAVAIGAARRSSRRGGRRSPTYCRCSGDTLRVCTTDTDQLCREESKSSKSKLHRGIFGVCCVYLSTSLSRSTYLRTYLLPTYLHSHELHKPILVPLGTYLQRDAPYVPSVPFGWLLQEKEVCSLQIYRKLFSPNCFHLGGDF